MSFKARLRNVCLVLLAVLLLLFGLTTTTAYVQGGMPPSQYVACLYLLVAFLIGYAYLVIHWRD